MIWVGSSRPGKFSVERAGCSPLYDSTLCYALTCAAFIKRQSRWWIFALNESFIWKLFSVTIKAFIKPSSSQRHVCNSGIKLLAVIALEIFGELLDCTFNHPTTAIVWATGIIFSLDVDNRPCFVLSKFYFTMLISVWGRWCWHAHPTSP